MILERRGLQEGIDSLLGRFYLEKFFPGSEPPGAVAPLPPKVEMEWVGGIRARFARALHLQSADEVRVDVDELRACSR